MNFLEKAMGDLYESVHAYVSKAFNTLSDRVAAAEKRITEIPAGQKGDKGDPGRDADPELIRREIEKAVSEISVPKDGKDGKTAYQLAVERGFSGTELQWLDSLKGEPGEKGEDGKSLSVEIVRALVTEEVAKAVNMERQKDAEMADVFIKGLEEAYVD